MASRNVQAGDAAVDEALRVLQESKTKPEIKVPPHAPRRAP